MIEREDGRFWGRVVKSECVSGGWAHTVDRPVKVREGQGKL